MANSRGNWGWHNINFMIYAGLSVLRARFSSPIIVCALLMAFGVAAAELPADVLARNRWMELTVADWEAALGRIPENLRADFPASRKRVETLLNNLVVNKTLAAQARVHGATEADARDPNQTRALAAAELQRVEADANAAFDAKRASFEAKAREIYMLDRERYRKPAEARFSDIAVTIKDRGEEAALARAREARQRVVAGADFAAVAREYSDDPVTRDKGGSTPLITAKDLAPEYAAQVFALSRIGEISEPIKTPAAYHVVRLDERRPSRVPEFDEVRDEIVKELRQQYVTAQRDLRIQSINADPTLEVNQPAIDALVKRVDPNVFVPDSAALPSSPSSPVPR
jgi:parvulin-like peptidyl-prolyl isomerase